MRSQCLVGALAIVIVWVMLAPVPVAGQVQTAGAETGKSRTSWGDPDLQGVWDFRTLTPLERPDELAGKEVFTAEEAAEFVEASLAEIAGRDDEVPADIVGNYNQFWFDRGTTVVGTRRTSRIVDPPDGRLAAPDAGGASGEPHRRRHGGLSSCRPRHRPPRFRGRTSRRAIPVHPARQGRPAHQPWCLQQ